jgi:hypothetical protein
VQQQRNTDYQQPTAGELSIRATNNRSNGHTTLNHQTTKTAPPTQDYLQHTPILPISERHPQSLPTNTTTTRSSDRQLFTGHSTTHSDSHRKNQTNNKTIKTTQTHDYHHQTTDPKKKPETTPETSPANP